MVQRGLARRIRSEERRVGKGERKHRASVQAEDGIRDGHVTGVQTCALPIFNDLIEEFAPNLKEIFKENPEVRKAITHPDGNIYALPTLDDPDFLAIRVSANPWFREDWLDELDRKSVV